MLEPGTAVYIHSPSRDKHRLVNAKVVKYDSAKGHTVEFKDGISCDYGRVFADITCSIEKLGRVELREAGLKPFTGI